MPDPKKAEQDRLRANVAKRQQDTNRSTATTATFTPNEAKLAAERAFSWGGGVVTPQPQQVSAGPRIGAAPYAPAPQMRPMTAGEQVDYAGRRIGEEINKATLPAAIISSHPAVQATSSPGSAIKFVNKAVTGQEVSPQLSNLLGDVDTAIGLAPASLLGNTAKKEAKTIGKAAFPNPTKGKTGLVTSKAKSKVANTKNFAQLSPEAEAQARSWGLDPNKRFDNDVALPEGKGYNYASARKGVKGEEGKSGLSPALVKKRATRVAAENTAKGMVEDWHPPGTKAPPKNKAKGQQAVLNPKGSVDAAKGQAATVKKPKTASELQAIDREREARMRSLENKQMAGKANFAERKEPAPPLKGEALKASNKERFDAYNKRKAEKAPNSVNRKGRPWPARGPGMAAKEAGNLNKDQTWQHPMKSRVQTSTNAAANKAMQDAKPGNREGSADELSQLDGAKPFLGKAIKKVQSKVTSVLEKGALKPNDPYKPGAVRGHHPASFRATSTSMINPLNPADLKADRQQWNREVPENKQLTASAARNQDDNKRAAELAKNPPKETMRPLGKELADVLQDRIHYNDQFLASSDPKKVLGEPPKTQEPYVVKKGKQVPASELKRQQQVQSKTKKEFEGRVADGAKQRQQAQAAKVKQAEEKKRVDDFANSPDGKKSRQRQASAAMKRAREVSKSPNLPANSSGKFDSKMASARVEHKRTRVNPAVTGKPTLPAKPARVPGANKPDVINRKKK